MCINEILKQSHSFVGSTWLYLETIKNSRRSETIVGNPLYLKLAASPVRGGLPSVFFLGGSSSGHWFAMKLQDVKSVRNQLKHSNKPTIMLRIPSVFVGSTSGVPVTNGSEKKRQPFFLKPSHFRRISQIIRPRKQQENGREAILIHCNYCISFILNLIPLTCRTQKKKVIRL